MQHNEDYLLYQLPPYTAEHYAKNAIEILTELKNTFPELYTPFLLPSEILTISGVRAFNTYYELGEEVDEKRVNQLKKFFQSKGILLIEDTFPVVYEQNKTRAYSLVHIESLYDLPNRYKKLSANDNPLSWNKPDLEHITHETDFWLWWFMWQFRIANNANDATVQKWRAQDGGYFQNLTFGMLLGYPGVAICDNLDAVNDESLASELIHASISHSDTGARPVYDYQSNNKNNSTILNHQALWSAILSSVYKSIDKPRKD